MARFHPYSEIFPLLEGAALDELAADIKAFGLREPIWTYQGQILDGRNRWLACQQVHVDPQCRTYKGTEKGAKALVWSANYHRRHLTESQRALAAASLANLGKGRPETNASAEAFTQTEAAAQAGISRSSLQRAKKVVDKGSKALVEAVKGGEISVNKAAGVIDLPKRDQLAAATADNEKDPEKPDVSADEEADALEAAEREFNASLDKVLKADDKLAAAHAEIKRQAGEIASLNRARNQFMNEKREAVKLLKAEQSKCERLQKKLKAAERENEKLRERIAGTKG